MKSRVKPLKPIIPAEFSSKCRITSKQFAFSQPVPRVKSVQSAIPPKTFQDESDAEENENSLNQKNQTTNENDNKAENQSNIENNETELKQQNDKDITVIDDIDQEINNEEEEEFTSQSNSEQKFSSILDDEEMISLKNELMESHDFSQIENSKLNKFYQYIKEYTKYTASQADYEEAKKSKKLKDETSNAIYIKKNDKERSDEEKKEIEKMKAQQEEKWQNEVDSYDQETAQKLEDLNKRQANERRSLDDFWNAEKTLRKYRKPSSRLLQLWRMEKFLAKTGSFDEAAIVRLEAAELAKREIALAQANANRDYHFEKEKLAERQVNDVASLVSNREHWRAVMLSRQQTEKDHIVNREAVVEVRQKEPLPKREAQLPPERRRVNRAQHAKKSNSRSLSRTSTATASSTQKTDIGNNSNSNTNTNSNSSINNSCNVGEVKKSQTSKKQNERTNVIEFNYCTVLPPVNSPVTGNNTPSDARSTASERSTEQFE